MSIYDEQSEADKEKNAICEVTEGDIRNLLYRSPNAMNDVKVFICVAGGLYKIPWNKIFGFVGKFTIPAGVVIDWLGNPSDGLPPDGWLFCDGSPIDQNKYPKLYHLCGGVLPDFSARHASGVYGDDKVAEEGGAYTEVLGSEHIPKHDHKYTVVTCAMRKEADHATGTFENDNGRGVGKTWRSTVREVGRTNVGSEESGRTLNLNPPCIVANKIIKAH